MNMWDATMVNLHKSESELAKEAQKLIGKLERDMQQLCDDPMTSTYGAPVDDIFFSQRKKHIAACSEIHDKLMVAGMTDLARQLSDEIFQWMEN